MYLFSVAAANGIVAASQLIEAIRGWLRRYSADTPYGVAEFAQAFRAEFDRYGQMSQLTYVRYLSLGPVKKPAHPRQPMNTPAHCVSLSSLHAGKSSSSIGMTIYAVSIPICDSGLSPIIDIHLPSPSMKKTHGR